MHARAPMKQLVVSPSATAVFAAPPSRGLFDASVSVGAATSSPLHVSVLVASVRTMKMYVAVTGASNQPCDTREETVCGVGAA